MDVGLGHAIRPCHRLGFFLAFDFDSAVLAAVKGLSASRWRCSSFSNFASRMARRWSTRGEGCLLMGALSETVFASYIMPSCTGFRNGTGYVVSWSSSLGITDDPRLIPERT